MVTRDLGRCCDLLCKKVTLWSAHCARCCAKHLAWLLSFSVYTQYMNLAPLQHRSHFKGKDTEAQRQTGLLKVMCPPIPQTSIRIQVLTTDPDSPGLTASGPHISFVSSLLAATLTSFSSHKAFALTSPSSCPFLSLCTHLI